MDPKEDALRNLLAVVHRDGGHHASDHGLRASAEAAETEVLRLRAELEAARAVVEWAGKQREAQAACDAEAERPAPSRSSAPVVRLIGCTRRLYEALDAHSAAKAGKAVE